jgi:Cu-processing system permease protein
VGKYAGLVLTLLVNVAVMTIALYAVLGYMSWVETPAMKAAWEAPALDPALLKAVFLIAIELMLVTAIALFFSTFSTPLLSAALTFGLYIAGRFNADLKNLDKVVDSRPTIWLARAAYHVLPDFAAFDVKTEVVHGLPVSARYLSATALYGALYITALLVIATMVFSRRDFK